MTIFVFCWGRLEEGVEILNIKVMVPFNGMSFRGGNSSKSSGKSIPISTSESVRDAPIA